jgi:hypothetical protein
MELRARNLRVGLSGPGVLLRVEGVVLLVLSVLLYWLNGGKLGSVRSVVPCD